MKKTKKTFVYMFGAFVGLLFDTSRVFAQSDLAEPFYGVLTPAVPISQESLWQKIASFIMQPIVLLIAGVLIVVVGSFAIGVKVGKNKWKNNVKKNIQKG
jgi:hypothetical protein